MTSFRDGRGVGATPLDYPRLGYLSADGEARRAVILVRHASDDAIAVGSEVLRELSSQGMLRPVLVVCVNGTELTTDCVIDGDLVATDVFDALHRSGRIDRVDIVSGCSEAVDGSDAIELANAATDLVHRFRRLAAPITTVWDHRVSLCSHDAYCPAVFEGTVDTRIVIIGEDRRFPSAMARPLRRADTEAFGLHVAVELASLCGLWNAGGDTPLARVDFAASGNYTPLVILARSMVRSVRLLLPSVSAAMQQQDRLPVPVGAQRSPIPEEMIRRAGEDLYPEELRFRPPETVQPSNADGPRYLQHLGTRLKRDFRMFPRRLRSAVRGELSSVVDEMEHRLRSPTWLTSETVDEPESRRPLEGTRATRPSGLYRPETWRDLIRATLGVADGTKDNRPTAIGTSLGVAGVVTSKKHLATDVAEANEMEAVYFSLRGAGGVAQQSENSMMVADANDDDGTDDGVGDTHSTDDVATDDHGDLLQRLTAEFERELRRAGQALSECNSKMQACRTEWRRKDRSVELLKAVPYLMTVGVVLAILAWTVLPGWLPQLDNEADTVKFARASILLTAALFVALFFLNLPKSMKHLQIYVIVGSVLILGTTTLLLLRGGTVESLVMLNARSKAPLLVILGLLAMAACIWILNRNSRSGRTSSRVSAACVLTYLLILSIAVLNDDSFNQGISFLFESRSTYLIVSSVIAVTTIISSFTVMSVVNHLHERERRLILEELRTLDLQHDEIRRRVDDQSTVVAHWLGTATSLHRLFRYPYGESHQEESEGADLAHTVGRNTDSPAAHCDLGCRVDASLLMKYIFCEMKLTETGQNEFNRLLRSELAQPGWLYGQYLRATEAHLCDGRSSWADTPNDHGLPHECAYPYKLSDELLTTSDGDRWPFVQALYRGEFDSALMSRATDFATGEGIDKILGDLTAFSVLDGTNSEQTPLKLLEELTIDLDPEIPKGILGHLALNFSDKERQMRSCLLWPEHLATPEGGFNVSKIQSQRHGDSVVHLAVRVDLSDPIPLNVVADAPQSVTTLSASRSEAVPEPNVVGSETLPEPLI